MSSFICFHPISFQVTGINRLIYFDSSSSLLEAEHFQQKLDETTVLLRELQKAQKERLSSKQPPNIICLLAPTAKELELGMHTH